MSRFVNEIDSNLIEYLNKEQKPKEKKEKMVYDSEQIYNYGDKVIHDIYGEGVVIEITNTILTIAFKKEIGIKKLLKNHKSIRKVKK